MPKVDTLSRMLGGWFVGNFTPSILTTKEFEVGIKRYQKGDKENYHTHKIATEITVILSGKVKMHGNIYYEDDIIKLKPGETSDFEALTDVITVVVKTPSVLNDKYIVSEINEGS